MNTAQLTDTINGLTARLMDARLTNEGLEELLEDTRDCMVGMQAITKEPKVIAALDEVITSIDEVIGRDDG